MRTEHPTVIHLKNYQAPTYLIDKTELTVELFEDQTLVHARLWLRRNLDVGTQALEPLVLQGQALELLSVAMEGRRLGVDEYQVDEQQLVLHPRTENFQVETCVRIHPETNTALEGLYKSGQMFCTQCEAEGFRKITYYLDRPDVMSRFVTTLKAERQRYPILLSNGNPVAQGEESDGRHWATWEDPFPKPAYLFALVAGDLWCVEDRFVTCSGREVVLRIYVEPENIDRCQHAMNSLKRAMRWDEAVYGREYDLDIFMIVAVNDFNMGAMENKGLNIFNASAVLARAETATDAAHQRIEAIVAHEYFHNWSGNRVTCRDWFQLSLKEGFTVFRDACFSADMNSPTVKRIEDVRYLRTHQFAEDAGPMAHPVRPDSFIEISNFYTLTVYEKGGEVVRMLHTLLGADGFRRGTDLYFSRHDGQAVTCDDFVRAMEQANDIDLSQFRRWYSQAGTPQLEVIESYDPARGCYSLTFHQSCPPTPGQPHKDPQVIPVRMGLLDSKGQPLPLQLEGEPAPVGIERVLLVNQAKQCFTFTGLKVRPLPSLLRGLSAPVRLSFAYDRDQLLFLLQHDVDGFNRWEACQQLAVQALQDLVGQYHCQEPMVLDTRLVTALSGVLNDESLDPAMVAEMLVLPSEAYLVELSELADVEAIHAAREFARHHLACALQETLWQRYRAARLQSQQTPYEVCSEQVARRALQNVALDYLMLTEETAVLEVCLEQFAQADNMTERQAALVALVNSPFEEAKAQVLEQFANEFREDALVMDLWFSVQAGSSWPGALERVKQLMQHPAFNLKNPNKVRALIGGFVNHNLVNFHCLDGSGYRFLADQVIVLNALNPQIAARLLTPLTRWRKFAGVRQTLMTTELQRVLAVGDLSPDVYEVASKSLGS